MSLLVWLPLTQNNSNQGLLNLTPTNQGTISFIDGGKLGKCLSAGNSSQTTNGISYNSTLVNELGTKFSASIWVKPLGNHVHYNGTFVSSGNWNAKRWSFGVSQNNTQVDVFGNGHNKYVNCSVPVNQWTHLVCTNDNGTVKLYKNGEYVTTTTISAGLESDAGGNFTVGRETYASGYFSFNGNINDLRIYNHVLSEKEIKELSKGLVCHYPLNDNSIQHMSNSYSNPTFAAIAGWGFWGNTGHSGHYGLNTDKQFIYNKSQTNSCWISDDSSATADYLIYQSPGFDGGYRSMCAVIKESNSKPITESIAYPVWNASVSGGLPSGKWTSVRPLTDGFYLCKVEGFQQDGSNDLVGIYVKPGYKIYISEMYLENNRTVCSDFLYSSNIVYDTSGNGYNGSVVEDSASPTIVSNDTMKYSASTNIRSTSSYIKISNLPTSGFGNSYTFAWWAKVPNYNGMHWGFSDGIRLNGMYTGRLWNTGDSSQNPLYNPGTTTQVNTPTANVWHHWVMTGDGTTCKVYQDGVLWATAKTYKSISGTIIYINGWDSSTSYKFSDYKISDFRIYATALSAEDIKELYNTAATIDKSGNIYSYEFKEV
jgi:hypothetical protein